jgi:hypothetical protein
VFICEVKEVVVSRRKERSLLDVTIDHGGGYRWWGGGPWNKQGLHRGCGGCGIERV